MDKFITYYCFGEVLLSSYSTLFIFLFIYCLFRVNYYVLFDISEDVFCLLSTPHTQILLLS